MSAPPRDTTEAEELAEVLRTASWPVKFAGETKGRDVATYLAKDVLASDWLAARDAAQRAAALREAAEAIDGPAEAEAFITPEGREWLRRRADWIGGAQC